MSRSFSDNQNILDVELTFSNSIDLSNKTYKPSMVNKTISNKYIFFDPRFNLTNNNQNTNNLLDFKKSININNNNYSTLDIITSNKLYIDFIEWFFKKYPIQNILTNNEKDNDAIYIIDYSLIQNKTPNFSDFNIVESTYSKDSKDSKDNTYINLYKKILEKYIEQLLPKEKNITINNKTYIIRNTTIEKFKINSNKNHKLIIDIDLMIESDDDWKQYSTSCRSQRTRINNIFSQLIKHTFLSRDSLISVDFFSRNNNNKDNWNKLTNNIKKQFNRKTLDEAKVNKPKYKYYNARKKYHTIDDKLNSLINKYSNQELTKDISYNIRKERKIIENELNTNLQAISKFTRASESDIYNQQTDFYIQTSENLILLTKSLEKQVDDIKNKKKK